MDTTIHLLWTGGWDSTYRLIDALATTEKTVQPHYLRDHERPSTQAELDAMDAIRVLLAQRFAHLGERLRPTLITDRASLKPRESIRGWFANIRKKAYLGSQYEWLAEYALREAIPLELAIHVDDRAYTFIHNDVVKKEVQGDSYFVLADRPSDPNLELFRPFRFPILTLTKLEMEERAKSLGTSEILEASWFCYRPRNGKPCGTCPPCQYTIEEGLGRRIPLGSRLLYYSQKPLFAARRALSTFKYR